MQSRPLPTRVSLLCVPLVSGVLACLLSSGASAFEQTPATPQTLADTDNPIDALMRPSLSPLEATHLPRSLSLDLKPIDLTAQTDDLWQRIRQGFAIRNISSPQVPQRMSMLLADPDRLKGLLERAGPYLYFIVEECERRGLPTELALLPFVESSFNPHATSPAGAAGLWQFIPSTGRVFKLKQDGIRDERRDVVASTQAALDYLSQLYEMYGDWYLALAAYNWGEGSVRRALEHNRKSQLGEDYLSLRMPDETRNYVPKLQAIKNIIDSPAVFNFALPHIDNKPFFASVARSKTIDMQTAARLADMPLADFKKLNPGFRSHIPAASDAGLLVPADKAEQFEHRLKLHSQSAAPKVGLKANPAQTNGFTSMVAGSGSDSELKDSTYGYFRPYLLKPQEKESNPLRPGSKQTVGTSAKTNAAGSAKPITRPQAPTAPTAPTAPNAPASPARKPG
jgi:hypothetical protein